jgi:O-antigen/teichoic acid export membrane protein
VLAAVVSFGVLFPRLNEIKRVFTWEQLKPLLYKSLPYATLGLIMMLYTRLDVLLIKKMAPDGNTENGIYAQSTRLLEAVNMMAVLVSGLLLPMFASIIQQRQSLSPLVKLAMIVVLVPAILGVTCCYVFGDEVMKLLYHETSDYQVSVFKWSISSVLPMCVMYVFGTLLTSRGSIKLLIQCALVAFVFNVLVNSYVIPRYGALGAAMVALGTHSIIALSNTYFALNKLKLNITSIHLLKFPLLGILSYTVVVFFKETGIFSTLSLLGMHLLTGGLLVLLLQMIDPDTLKKALKRIQ